MSDNEPKIVEGSALKDAVEIASKPCIEILESTIIKALSIIDNEFKNNYPDAVRLHAEASIYEEVAVTCAERIDELGKKIAEKNDPARAALVKLSLNIGMQKAGVDTSQLS